MAFLNYLLAVKATRNLASVRYFLDGLAPDNDRGSQRTCRQIAGSVGLARTRKRMSLCYHKILDVKQTRAWLGDKPSRCERHYRLVIHNVGRREMGKMFVLISKYL
jgi:hypothetical protein